MYLSYSHYYGSYIQLTAIFCCFRVYESDVSWRFRMINWLSLCLDFACSYFNSYYDVPTWIQSRSWGWCGGRPSCESKQKSLSPKDIAWREKFKQEPKAELTTRPPKCLKKALIQMCFFFEFNLNMNKRVPDKCMCNLRPIKALNGHYVEFGSIFSGIKYTLTSYYCRKYLHNIPKYAGNGMHST